MFSYFFKEILAHAPLTLLSVTLEAFATAASYPCALQWKLTSVLYYVVPSVNQALLFQCVT